MQIFSKIALYIKNNLPIILLATALLLSLFSMKINSNSSSLSDKTAELKQIVHIREALLEEYAFEALDAPATELLDIHKLPRDMVLYRYILFL